MKKLQIDISPPQQNQGTTTMSNQDETKPDENAINYWRVGEAMPIEQALQQLFLGKQIQPESCTDRAFWLHAQTICTDNCVELPGRALQIWNEFFSRGEMWYVVEHLTEEQRLFLYVRERVLANRINQSTYEDATTGAKGITLDNNSGLRLTVVGKTHEQTLRAVASIISSGVFDA